MHLLDFVQEPTLLLIGIFLILILMNTVYRVNKLESKLNDYITKYDKLNKDFTEHAEKGATTREKLDIIDKYIKKQSNYDIIKDDKNKDKVRDKALVENKISSMLDPRNKESKNDSD